jgi:6-phosphogluconate dehydrogenase
MGENIALNLIDHGWKVVGYNRSEEVTKRLEKKGLVGAYSYQDFFEKLAVPRIVWVMVPAGEPVNEVIKELSETLAKGDIVVDGGNSYFEESKKHHELLSKRSIDFVDVGVSGGPEGARRGASLMVGGNEKLYDYLLPLYLDLAVDGGYQFFEGVGAGHFVKMVHNGIEYGMMQAIAEGFDIMSNSDYKLHLQDIARVYDHGSVIESRLTDWMEEAFGIFGDDLKKVSGSAGSGGAKGIKASEAKWTVDFAKKVGVEAKIISESIDKRLDTQKNPDFQGKIINALRNRFGGHSVKEK